MIVPLLPIEHPSLFQLHQVTSCLSLYKAHFVLDQQFLRTSHKKWPLYPCIVVVFNVVVVSQKGQMPNYQIKNWNHDKERKLNRKLTKYMLLPYLIIMPEFYMENGLTWKGYRWTIFKTKSMKS